MGFFSNFIIRETELGYFIKFEALISIILLSLCSIIFNIIGINYSYYFDIPVEICIFVSFIILTVIIYSISVIINNFNRLSEINLKTGTIMLWILAILLFSMAVYSIIVLIFINYLGTAKLNSTDFFSFLGVLMTFLFVIVTAISVNISREALKKSDESQKQTQIQINMQQKQLNLQNVDKKKERKLKELQTKIDFHKLQLEKYYIPLYNNLDDLLNSLSNYNFTKTDYHVYSPEFRQAKHNLDEQIRKTKNIIQQYVYLEGSESIEFKNTIYIFSYNSEGSKYTTYTDMLLEHNDRLLTFRENILKSEKCVLSLVFTILYITETISQYEYLFYLHFFLEMLKESKTDKDYPIGKKMIVDDVFRTRNVELIMESIDHHLEECNDDFWRLNRGPVMDEFSLNVRVFLNDLYLTTIKLNEEILKLEKQKEKIESKYDNLIDNIK